MLTAALPLHGADTRRHFVLHTSTLVAARCIPVQQTAVQSFSVYGKKETKTIVSIIITLTNLRTSL